MPSRSCAKVISSSVGPWSGDLRRAFSVPAACRTGRAGGAARGGRGRLQPVGDVVLVADPGEFERVQRGECLGDRGAWSVRGAGKGGQRGDPPVPVGPDGRRRGVADHGGRGTSRANSSARARTPPPEQRLTSGNGGMDRARAGAPLSTLWEPGGEISPGHPPPEQAKGRIVPWRDEFTDGGRL
jgi:hypothetical protein